MVRHLLQLYKTRSIFLWDIFLDFVRHTTRTCAPCGPSTRAGDQTKLKLTIQAPVDVIEGHMVRLPCSRVSLPRLCRYEYFYLVGLTVVFSTLMTMVEVPLTEAFNYVKNKALGINTGTSSIERAVLFFRAGIFLDFVMRSGTTRALYVGGPSPRAGSQPTSNGPPLMG